MNNPKTLGSLYRNLIIELSNAQIDKPYLEARILLTHAADIEESRITGHPEVELDCYSISKLKKIAERRKHGEPIAYIVGEKEFWSLNFSVTKETLIPRPDSEILIEAVLNMISNYTDSLSILDLGTGSGCLLLALLTELPNANGIGIDISSEACMVAKKNSENLGLSERAKFRQGNWMDNIQDKFDIIITNPPYIANSQIKYLTNEVRFFEPHLALSGGPDGLSAYRLIIKDSTSHLKPDGILAAEIGINQRRDISDIFIENGLKIVKVQRDYSNIERCILATVGHS